MICPRVRRADRRILLLQSWHRRTVNYFIRQQHDSPAMRERTVSVRSRMAGEMVAAIRLPVCLKPCVRWPQMIIRRCSTV
jgi:hypothetical protein